MMPFTTLDAVAAPLLRDNVDTDAIIPSREMTSVSKVGLADGLFANWRYWDAAARTPDPEFVLNDPAYAGAQILLAGENFGCGSSREHAAWALAEYGFRAVLAVSFNPIFRSNCVSNGILPAVLDRPTIARIASTGPQLTIDLPGCTISAATGETWSFTIDGEARDALLSGMDAIERTMTHRDHIQSQREADKQKRPWIYL